MCFILQLPNFLLNFFGVLKLLHVNVKTKMLKSGITWNLLVHYALKKIQFDNPSSIMDISALCYYTLCLTPCPCPIFARHSMFPNHQLAGNLIHNIA